MSGAVLFVFLLLGFLFTFGLSTLIGDETSNPTIVDRETAEREAQKQGGLRDGGAKGSEHDESEDGGGETNRW
ncbi:hypothetical protein ACNS7O_11310 [Haloferacaceae archaeon DSL9]